MRLSAKKDVNDCIYTTNSKLLLSKLKVKTRKAAPIEINT